MGFFGSCVVDPLTCVGTSVGSSVLQTALSTFVGWMADASAWVWGQLGDVLTQASGPAVVTTAAGTEYQTLLVLAPLVALCALVANVLGSLRRADGGAILRDLLIAVPVLALAAVSAIPLATLVLAITNGLCSVALANASASITHVASEVALIPAGTPGLAEVTLDFAAIAGAIILWFELVIRNAVLALLLCLSPLVFASAIWAPLRRTAVRLVETFVALALSKFVVVVALALGLSAASSSAPSVIVTGIATVLLATLMPYVLLRMVPFLENSAVGALEGVRQRAQGAVERGVKAATSGIANAMPADVPGPPERSEDLGLEWWPSSEWPPLPEVPDTPPTPPVGSPTIRTGHVAYQKDEYGPQLGWHWDE
jgi:hypothetical protein